MNLPCGCCEGLEELTPLPTANRPGLRALVYRVGTHPTFLATMEARLSGLYLEIPPEQVGSWLLEVGELFNAGRLAVKWHQAQDKVSQHLRHQFSAETQRLIDEHDASGPASEQLQNGLVRELNRLIAGASLYDEQRFAHVTLTAEIQELLHEQNLGGKELTRLNRLLLEAAYPHEIAKRQRIFPLRSLTTRTADDPAIALLDAWATVADVLTFYEERIANEGYLRTATERRSVLELGRLVGYSLRPGVASSVYLAYTLETGVKLQLAAGERAQSVPGPLEFPQSFETAEPFEARAEWNRLQPRLTRPQRILPNRLFTVYLQGTGTNLKPNDPMLFLFREQSPGPKQFRQIVAVEAQAAANRTKVTIQQEPPARQSIDVDAVRQIVDRHLVLKAFGISPRTDMAMQVVGILEQLKTDLGKPDISLAAIREQHLPLLRRQRELATTSKRLGRWLEGLVTSLEKTLPAAGQQAATQGTPFETLDDFVAGLSMPPAAQVANRLRLVRGVEQTFSAQSDFAPQFLVSLKPALKSGLYQAWSSAQVTPAAQLESANALRVKASAFGNNAPLKPILNARGVTVGTEEWPLAGTVILSLELGAPAQPGVAAAVSGPLLGGTVEGSIAITRAGETRSEPLSVKQDTTVLGVAIAITKDAHQNITSISFKLDRQEIKVAQDAARLTVDAGNGPTPVPPGSSLRFSVGDRKITVDFRDTLSITDTAPAPVPAEQRNVLALDATYDQITPGSWVAIKRADRPVGNALEEVIAQVERVQTVSKADYGITSRVTQLTLSQPWLDGDDVSLQVVRNTTVFAQSEALPLAEEPIPDAVEGAKVELDALYDGLDAGRWLIVSGERTDIPGATGVAAAELAMLAGVEQGVQQIASSNPGVLPLPGDKVHSFLQLANGLAYSYKRDTLTVYGNVVKATHGETRSEVLGSGDASKSMQQFMLGQSPLTYLAAPTAVGVASTLQVRVNGVLWREVDGLAGLPSTAHSYILRTNDEDKTTVIFGDGRQGARLPTGVENIKATYRTGIGKPGNVKAGQISLLATRPLGVKSVINPLPATGGADRETDDQARRNIPAPVKALDRLVSVEDYADFARAFAGIGKAAATELSDGRRQVVHVTVAGAGDIPIDKQSDLYRNLLLALEQQGDPSLPIQVDTRELLLIIISAKVRLLPEYEWESVAPKIRAALLDTLGFERRALGQDVPPSEVIGGIQAVAGVAYVDLDILDSVAEGTKPSQLRAKLTSIGASPPARIVARMARFDTSSRRILPAQLAYLSAEIPDTLLLTLIQTERTS